MIVRQGNDEERLDDLDEADRGFLTWQAAAEPMPMDELRATIGVVPDGDRIRDLDLSPLAPRVAHRSPAPPFAGLDGHVHLDCSSLRLGRLDLTHHPTLRHQLCARDALRDLDLGPAPELELRATGDGFASQVCPFEPRDDRTTASVEGVDWTADGDGTVAVPEVLAHASSGPQSNQPKATTAERHHPS